MIPIWVAYCLMGLFALAGVAYIGTQMRYAKYEAEIEGVLRTERANSLANKEKFEVEMYNHEQVMSQALRAQSSAEETVRQIKDVIGNKTIGDYL